MHNAYTMDPNKLTYSNVVADVTGQDYVGTMLTYKISGYIEISYPVAIEGVLVEADNDGTSDTTDASGYYEVWVDYNWSGTVRLSKAHYIFIDPNNVYFSVQGDIAQNYLAENIYDLDLDGSIGFGDLAVMSNNWLLIGVGVTGGDFFIDEDDIINLQDFVELAKVWQD